MAVQMTNRHAAIDNALASAHLEGVDPGPEAIAAMRAWADSGRPAAELGEMAKLAAAGLPLQSESVQAA